MSSPTPTIPGAGSRTASRTILAPKKTGTRVFGYIVLVLVIALVIVIAVNPNFKWGTVGSFMFDPNILVGIVNTLLLTVCAMAAGIVLGAVLALMKLSNATQLQILAEGYIWIFRGIPLLVQLLFWFNMAALFPKIGIGIPGTDVFVGFNANELISPFMAGFLALALHEAAYMAEIIRSGIMSIDKGQTEAAEAVAMRPSQVMFRIILPQAMRVIIPPTGNQVISMLKTTSIVSVIALNDLLYSSQIIYSTNFQVIPLLLVASIWYLIIVSLLTLVQNRIERHFNRSTHVITGK
ncbi:amino acid ABC transporter permease [Brevibacterium sp. 50QC2O2]|uniref:amino acid ABC transporter permease n=1 Tax=Brevibacterium TaxID=1696 RepID=UPI00211B9C66|nr:MULTISPECIES: amino acid ABC transporter permease [unclassified Brevibacterium]MCQ9385708.1 amino acid ABC transporter permease [Brevibacterium sp. 68QC2CO]MCQ9388159.1 amino acid ABC transporter permease [Brevibacterium sp. 50QC2O2]